MCIGKATSIVFMYNSFTIIVLYLVKRKTSVEIEEEERMKILEEERIRKLQEEEQKALEESLRAEEVCFVS